MFGNIMHSISFVPYKNIETGDVYENIYRLIQ